MSTISTVHSTLNKVQLLSLAFEKETTHIHRIYNVMLSVTGSKEAGGPLGVRVGAGSYFRYQITPLFEFLFALK